MTAPNLICRTCLRDFSDDTGPGREKQLAYHRLKCRLPYTQIAHDHDGITVYFLPPDAPALQKRFAFRSVVCTMHHSDEIPADKIGWYPRISREVRTKLQPHVFVPIRDGQTCGVVIAERRSCRTVTFTRRQGQHVSEEAVRRWTICRAWVYESCRRQGIASATVSATACYFGVDVSELGWMLPMSPRGENLRAALVKGPMHVTTG
jgi:hypothetical protein